MGRSVKIAKYNFVCLFAGSGILLPATQEAGFNNLGLIKSRKCNSELISKNFPFLSVVPYDCEDDVSINFFLSYLNIQESQLDLLTTVISLENDFLEKNSLNDNFFVNGNLERFLCFLKAIKPKTFLINFDKDTTPKNFSILRLKSIKIFLKKIEELGYVLKIKELNAREYRVSQDVIYLVIVGIREDINSLSSFEFPKKSKRSVFLNDVLRQCPKSIGVSYAKWKEEIFEYVPPGGNWKNIPNEIIEKYKTFFPSKEKISKNFLKRLDTNDVCPIINILPKQVYTDACHPFENRPLNVKEAARCKSIPDTINFFGDKKAQYRQVAKALPYSLIFLVTKQIKIFLDEIDSLK